MPLPGGLWRDGARRRGFAFRPLTGEIELAVAEAGRAPNPPAAVTSVLAAALAEVGGERATPEVVRELPVGDRQFLMRQLAAGLGCDGVWLSAPCGACGATFDLYVKQTALPVKEAGESYPFATAETGRGRRRLRVPSGADQEAIAGLDDREAVTELLRRCLDQDEEAEEAVGAMDAMERTDIAALDAALEAASPEVGLGVLATCPDCGAEQEVTIDPYLCLTQVGDSLFGEVHALAMAYHWPEPAILALPAHRRRLYFQWIDRTRGMVT
jgi:hypothetical protein